MKKNAPISVDQQADLSEIIAENPSVLWISENSRWIAYTLIGLIVLLFVVYRFTVNSSNQDESVYWKAQSDYQVMTNPEKDKIAQGESFKSLSSILERYPQLQSQYDTLIAQTLLSQNQVQEAMPYAERAIHRTQSENEPFYTRFSQTALVIASQDLQQGLNQAVQLREEMLKQAENGTKNFGDELYGFNLLRIASLQKALQQPEYKKTLQELMELSIGRSTYSSFIAAEPILQILLAVQENGVSLQNFVEAELKG